MMLTTSLSRFGARYGRLATAGLVALVVYYSRTGNTEAMAKAASPTRERVERDERVCG